MACRKVTFAAAQRSFLYDDACLRLIGSCEESDRPQKRRKVEAEEDELGWAPILDLVVECRFVDENLPNSSATPYETSAIPIQFVFDDPIMTVFDSTGRELFGFVSQEADVTFCAQICWLENLSKKDPSISQCVRMSSSLSFRHDGLQFESATLLFRLEVRFDRHLFGVKKLLVKDRVSILDYVFEKPATRVTTNHFYTDIGRLPKDYIDSNGSSLQHPALECKLFPFQKRAVAWMLQRERVGLENDNLKSSSGADDLPPLWEAITDRYGKTIYFNRHQGFVTTDRKWIQDMFPKQRISGGILAEAYLFFQVELTAFRKWASVKQ